MSGCKSLVVLCCLGAASHAFADAAAPELLFDLVVPRSEWGARAHGCGALDPSKDRATIHHTAEEVGGADFPDMLQTIQRVHMDSNGWCDVGYHFLVTMDGRIWEGRPIDYLGSHVLGENTGNIGISYAGCFDSDPYCDGKLPREPTDAALRSGAQLVHRLAANYGFTVDKDTVIGHRDHPEASTVCPGEFLHERLDEFRMLSMGELACDAVPETGGTLDDSGLCFDRRGEPALWTWSEEGQSDSLSQFAPLSAVDPMHVGAWQVAVEVEGWYRVESYLESGDPSPALYRVVSSDGANEIALEDTSGWQDLGVYYFDGDTSYEVSKGVDASEATGTIGFDTLRITPDENPDPMGGGCGCSSNGTTNLRSMLAPLLLLSLAFGLRRRSSRTAA